MKPLHLAAYIVLALLGIWIAYKIGKFLLRLVVGLAVLGMAAFVVWHFLHR